MGLTFADFEIYDGSERLYPAPSPVTDGEHENAPDPTGRGRSLDLEHETGFAGARRFAASVTAPGSIRLQLFGHMGAPPIPDGGEDSFTRFNRK